MCKCTRAEDEPLLRDVHGAGVVLYNVDANGGVQDERHGMVADQIAHGSECRLSAFRARCVPVQRVQNAVEFLVRDLAWRLDHAIVVESA